MQIEIMDRIAFSVVSKPVAGGASGRNVQFQITMIYNFGNRVVNNYLVSLGEEDNRLKKHHTKSLCYG